MRRSSGRAAIDVEPAQHAYRPDRPQLPIRRFPAGSRAPRFVARWRIRRRAAARVQRNRLSRRAPRPRRRPQRMDLRGLRPHRSQRRPARADRARDAPRRAFDDTGKEQHFARTVVRFGYRWVAPTAEETEATATAASSSPVWPNAIRRCTSSPCCAWAKPRRTRSSPTVSTARADCRSVDPGSAAPLSASSARQSDLPRRVRIRGAPPGRHRTAHGVPSAHPPPRLQTQVPSA